MKTKIIKKFKKEIALETGAIIVGAYTGGPAGAYLLGSGMAGWLFQLYAGKEIKKLIKSTNLNFLSKTPKTYMDFPTGIISMGSYGEYHTIKWHETWHKYTISLRMAINNFLPFGLYLYSHRFWWTIGISAVLIAIYNMADEFMADMTAITKTSRKQLKEELQQIYDNENIGWMKYMPPYTYRWLLKL